MLNDLDETIRQLLIRAGGGDFDSAQVDISFDIPNREWSTGIQRPTINCYLFDIHERRSLREEGWQVEGRGRNEATRRKPMLYFDISYLITAWTRAIENEHYLLWRALATLSRFSILSDPNIYLDDDILDNPFVERAPIVQGRPRLVDCLQGALSSYAEREDAPPIYTSIAQLEGVLKSPGEFWTALENHLKPSLNYVVTLAMDRQAMRAGAPVTTHGISIRIPEAPADQDFQIRQFITIPEEDSVEGITVAVEQASIRAITDADGKFRLKGLSPGIYTLNIEAGGKAHRSVIMIHGFRIDRIFPLPPGTALNDIRVLVKGENTELSTSTDQHGMFRLENLPPGQYSITAEIAGRTFGQKVLLRDPAARGVSQLSDVVRDQDGNPIAGVVVEVEGTDLRAVTDADGRFGFDTTPGTYTLIVHVAGGTQRRRVTVRNTGYTLTLNYGGKAAST
jgi:hypothetical protein